VSGWKHLLAERVRDAQCLVVRDGHPGEPEAPVLFETTDRVQLGQLLDTIEVDEPGSGGHCMCLGGPTLEFRSQSERLAAVGIHHGTSLRWRDSWPGDALLTPVSARRFCDWLLERGVESPWLELKEQEVGLAAEERRMAAVFAILPDEIARTLPGTEDGEDSLAAFMKSGRPPVELAGYCLQILGCDNASWQHEDRVSQGLALAHHVLPGLGRTAASEALRRFVIERQDRQACYGAARALYWYGRWEDFESDALEEALPVLTMVALEHPREQNRRIVMSVLAEIPGGDQPLREVMAGRVAIQPLPEAQVSTPPGMVTIRGRQHGEPADVSDRAYAAWLLARIGTTDVIPEIERLERSARGKDRDAFLEALRMLRGHDGA